MITMKYAMVALLATSLLSSCSEAEENIVNPAPVGSDEETVAPIEASTGYAFKEPQSDNVFYIDPIKGSSNGNGSANKPWKTLEDVLKKHVQYYRIENGNRTLVNRGAAVKGGDKLILKSGYHGKIQLSNGFSFDNWLTIEGEKGAVISKFHIKSTFSNIYLKNLTVCNKFDSAWNDWYTGFNATENAYMILFAAKKGFKRENIKLFNVTVTSSKRDSDAANWNKENWKKVCSGIKFSSAKNYEVINCKIKNTCFALRTDTAYNDKSFQGERGVFYNNLVKNFTGDAVHVATSDVRVDNNKLIGAIKINDNHDDLIQLIGKFVGGIKNIIIRNNELYAHGNIKDFEKPQHKSCQGIGAFDGLYENCVIENNVVVTNHYHGITLFGGKNCKIINNTVVDEFDGDSSSPWIQINNSKDGTKSKDILIANNIISRSVSFEGDTKSNSSIVVKNNYTMRSDFSLLNQLFLDYKAQNFKLKNNTLTNKNIIDKGIFIEGTFSSEYDKSYKSRGAIPSIGAYEI